MVTFNVPDTLAFNINGTTNILNILATSNTTNWAMTLPDDPGTNAYVLQTDGTGITSWVAQGGSLPSLNQDQFFVGDASNQAVDQGSVLTFSTATTNGPVFSIGEITSTTVTVNLGTVSASTANVVLNLSGGTGSSTIDHLGSGSFTISSTSGAVTVGSNLTVNGNVTTDSDFVFDSSATTNNLNVSASTNTTNWTMTLPDDPGTNAYVLQTDGTGITSWVAQGGSLPSLNQNQFFVGDASNQAVDQGSVLTFSTATVNGPALSVGDTTTTTATFNLASSVATTANAVINLSGGTGSSTIEHKGSGSFTISASNSGQITLVQSGIKYLWPTDTPAADEVLTVSSFNSPTATLNWTSTGLSSAEYRQVEVLSDTTAPANNAAVVFSTTAIVNQGSITNNGSGVFSIESGKTYRLVARLGVKNISSILSYQWYDNTNTQFVGIAAQAIGTDNPTAENTVNDAVAVVSSSSSVELRIITGGTTTTIDSTYSSAYVEKIADNTSISQFTGSTTASAGTIGYVPAPTTAEINYVLASNGSWVDYISKSSEDIIVNNDSTTGSIIMRPGTATTATSVRIQDSANQDQMYIEMDGGVFCPQLRNASGNTLTIDGTTGELLETVSLRAYKIQETLIEEEPGYNVEDVLKLEPKFFSWKDTGQRDLGFVVEDAVEHGLDHFLYYDSNGPKNFSDRSIIAGLVAIVKKMHAEIQELTR